MPSSDLLLFYGTRMTTTVGERAPIHIHMEGKDTWLVPHLIGRIVERLEALNTLDEDICEAHITIV